jgi:hypothetical protein
MQTLCRVKHDRNGEEVRIKKALITYFKVLTQHSTGDTGENHEKPEDGCLLGCSAM